MGEVASRLTQTPAAVQLPAELGERIERLAWGVVSASEEQEGKEMTLERVAKLEIKVDMVLDALKEIDIKHERSMKEIERLHGACRDRCDISRAGVYDRIREIEGEQKVNRGAHEQIRHDNLHSPQAKIAAANLWLAGIAILSMFVTIAINLLKG